MGRPATTPVKLKEGYYIELRRTGANSGIKIRRETYEGMLAATKKYEATYTVVYLGKMVKGKFQKIHE
ncbi:MAG: hypothetical protein RJQ09_00775 [Cyclobacteriaceae bacterium]